jgi:MraZ protein
MEQPHLLEGRWEAIIAQHGPQLAGRTVRVYFDAAEPAPDATATSVEKLMTNVVRSAGESAQTTPHVRSLMWGEYRHSVDDKGRVIMPMRWREVFDWDVVMTRAVNGSICVYPQQVWEEIARAIDSSPLDSERVLLQRILGSGLEQAILDQQHRIVLPRALRQWAEIIDGERVVLIGIGRMVEVWNMHKWEEHTDSLLRGLRK